MSTSQRRVSSTSNYSDNYLPETYGRPEHYRTIGQCEQMRLMVVDFLPRYAEMRKILMTIIKMEFLFDVYLLCCTLITEFSKDKNCLADPQNTTQIFFWAIIAPFFCIKLIMLNCCNSPQSVLFHVLLIWIL